MASPSPSMELSSPSNGKRKASAQLNGGNDKKKRSRVSFSCSECHRRKQKCDRQQPCGHCVARRVPELCHAYQPGKAEGDLHLRLSRVEHILELALPQYMNTGNSSAGSPSQHNDTKQLSHPSLQRALSPGTSEGSQTRDEEIPNAIGTLQDHGPFYGAEALGSVNATPIIEQFNVAQLPTVDEAAVAADKLRHLVQDCGVMPHEMEELVRGLPPKSYCDDLINFFFQEINYTRYPIFEPQFRAFYEALLAKEHRVHPIDLRFLPLLFIVLASAARLAPEHLIGGEAQRKVTSLRYYWSSRKSMMIAAAVGESLELVVARLLTSRYLTTDRRVTESWTTLGTAVRTALALGLHRDGGKLGLDPFQTEYRRRIWSYIYHADRAHALVLGRPPCVQDEYCDARAPTNTDDSFLMGPVVEIPRGLPLSQPTPMTFIILRQSLAVIIGHIVRHFQQVRPTHYSNVIALDEELMSFISILPPHYALNPDTSLDETLTYIPSHRFLINSEIFFVRISLHRPYMLRKLDSDRFAYSRRACFDSAKNEWESRQAFKKSTHPDVIRCLGGGYREFQAAMISGISLALDPHGPDAFAMHKILDSFLSEHANTHETDETTRRELKIIELLKSKSLAVANGEPINSPTLSTRIKPEIPDDSRVSALRTVTVSAPRPRGHSSASMANGTGGMASPSDQTTSASSSPLWPHRQIHHARTSSLEESGPSLSTNTSGNSPLEGSSSAQRLLNAWVDNAQIDSVGGGTFGLNGMDPSTSIMNNNPSISLGLSAGTAGALNVIGGSTWLDDTFNRESAGYPPPLGRSDSGDIHLLGGSGSSTNNGDPAAVDWNYWNILYEQIRGGGEQQA